MARRHPWWRPDGRQAYVGAVIIHDDRAFLRRLPKFGYAWTFPRRRLTRRDACMPPYWLTSVFAAELGVTIRRMVAIPGTWHTDHSVAQYWLVEASDYTPPSETLHEEASTIFGTDHPTETQLKAAWSYLEVGLPMSLSGLPMPLPPDHAAKLEALGAAIPGPVPSSSHGMDLEWVPLERVRIRLSESHDERGRRRDLNVWAAARQAGHVEKPLEERGIGWREECLAVRDDEVRFLDSRHDRRFTDWPFPVPDVPIEYYERAWEAFASARRTGWDLSCCFNCRHMKVSGVAAQAGGCWCTAARATDDERRCAISNALGWCPNHEPLMSDLMAQRETQDAQPA